MYIFVKLWDKVREYLRIEVATDLEIENELKKEAESLEERALHLENVAKFQERIDKAKERIKATSSGKNKKWTNKLLIVIGVIIIVVILVAQAC